MSPKKRYASIAELVHDVSEDKAFSEHFSKESEQRRLGRTLFAIRCVRGMSQADIAEHMKCTQSKISKLENGLDSDLSIGDIDGYASALGLEVHLVLMKPGQTVVDQIKFHACRIKHLLDYLADLASKDERIAGGVFRFFAETAFNLARFVRSSGHRLPDLPAPSVPRVSMEVDDDEESDVDRSFDERNGQRRAAPC